MLSLTVGCALPKPTGGPSHKPVAVRTAPLSQNLGTLAGTVQGPAAGLIANNGAGVLGNNSAGLIANNSAGLIANNSAGFRLLSGATRLEAVAGARVEVLDAASGKAVAKPVTTAPDGKYTVDRLDASGPLLFVRVSYEREGHRVTLLATVHAARKAGEVSVPVTPATTLVAKKLQETLRTATQQALTPDPAGLAHAAKQLEAVMSERAIVAAAILDNAQAAGTLDAMLAESAALRESLAQTGAIALVGAASPAPTAAPTPTPAASASAGASKRPTPTPTAIATAPAAPTATPAPTPPPARTWTVSTLAGNGQAGSLNATGTAARFDGPEGLALAANGDLYVADTGNEQTRRITPDGQVTRPTPGDETGPSDLAFDARGNLYAVEAAYSHVHRTKPDGSAILFAGEGPGFKDGRGTDAAFNAPTGVAVDGDGNVYVADTGNNRLRHVTPDRVVTTLDVTGLSTPSDLVVAPDKTLYVTEAGRHRISKITPAGTISTLVDGLKSPRGLAMDRHGNLYVADTSNHRICKVTPDGTLSVLAGDGTPGFADGEGTSGRFSSPVGVAVNAEGTVIYVGDRDNHRIRVIQ
jgi:sugar lactone lactonase YvrE